MLDNEVMSSYASLVVHGEELFTWRNEIEPTFLFLFTRDDVRRAPKPEDEIYDDDTEYILLETSVAILSERLDVLGIGRKAVQETFLELIADRVETFKGYDFMDPSYAAALEEIRTLDDWVSLLVTARKSRAKRGAEAIKDPTSVAGLMEIWEEVDPRYLVRATLLSCKPDDIVTLDVSDLIAGGWLDETVEPQQAALEYFSYALANGAPAVVVTEGSTDAEFLSTAIALRKPHLKSFIRFFDFGNGAEGSASAAVRTLKSFAAAGISNRVVLLLDNDAAAREAVRSLRRTKLPEHYTVRHYPELAAARSYPTIGPTGDTAMDVNGLAASLEMYLGADALANPKDGQPTPVQWRSYLPGVGAYQGEVLAKNDVQKRFRQKLKVAASDPKAMEGQDWTGVDLIIDDLIAALNGSAAPSHA